MTATVTAGEPTMQGAVLWTHHQYLAGKLPRKWLTDYIKRYTELRETLPTIFIFALVAHALLWYAY